MGDEVRFVYFDDGSGLTDLLRVDGDGVVTVCTRDKRLWDRLKSENYATYVVAKAVLDMHDRVSESDDVKG